MDLKFLGSVAAPRSPPALSGSPAAAWLAGRSLVKSLHFLQVRRIAEVGAKEGRVGFTLSSSPQFT